MILAAASHRERKMTEESAFKGKRITFTGFGLEQVNQEYLAISTRYKWYYFVAKPNQNQREKYGIFWRQSVHRTIRTETTQKFLLTLCDRRLNSIQDQGIKDKNQLRLLACAAVYTISLNKLTYSEKKVLFWSIFLFLLPVYARHY